MTIHVCFVCLGNICRSPTAEAVFRHHVQRAELGALFEIESAGTAAHHVGEPPDARSSGAAAERGIHLLGAARKFIAADFERFEFVLAMDRENLAVLRGLRSGRSGAELSLLRRFDPLAVTDLDDDVPDPYYGGPHGFERVLDICDRACQGLLAHIQSTRAIE